MRACFCGTETTNKSGLCDEHYWPTLQVGREELAGEVKAEAVPDALAVLKARARRVAAWAAELSRLAQGEPLPAHLQPAVSDVAGWLKLALMELDGWRAAVVVAGPCVACRRERDDVMTWRRGTGAAALCGPVGDREGSDPVERAGGLAWSKTRRRTRTQTARAGGFSDGAGFHARRMLVLHVRVFRAGGIVRAPGVHAMSSTPGRYSAGLGFHLVEERQPPMYDMAVKIIDNDKANPPGKLADAELIFLTGELAGLKLIGFGIWESRGGSRPRSVTFPARSYAVNGERRTFALLRPSFGADMNGSNRVRDLILKAYADHQATRSEPDDARTVAR